MSFFDQVYQTLFPKKDQTNKVLLHELIHRSDSYTANYRKWNGSSNQADFLKDLRTAYYLKSKGIEGKPSVHLLKSQYSNGFAISYTDELDQNEFQYLFDWLAVTIENAGYRKSNSDVTIMDKGNFIETREKHYLKPPTGKSIPLEQRYGNILIEHISVDDKPSFLKLVANIYNDRSYSKAESFEGLAEYLFD